MSFADSRRRRDGGGADFHRKKTESGEERGAMSLATEGKKREQMARAFAF
jgi:hypothetical protein